MARDPVSAEGVARGAALGRVLRSARLELGLSQESLARRARLSVETVRKVEQGARSSPEFFTVASLAYAMGASLDDLVRDLEDAE